MAPSKKLQSCPEDLLASTLQAAQADDQAGLEAVETLLGDYPDDPTLHFLRGSLLAATQRYGEAQSAMRKAVDLAPDFPIARFQLGFLQLSSGDPAAAEATWAQLEGLAADNPLRLFTQGLRHMVRDEFDRALELLGQGIALNDANPPLNNDMRLIMMRIEDLIRNAQGGVEEPTSSAHFLLQQVATKRTMH